MPKEQLKLTYDRKPTECGKTMLAQRIPTILPSLNFEEALEVTKIHSLVGNITEKEPLILERPFQNPHYSISISALVGGGKIPKPGEISLAHLGVLFLDEFAEFKGKTIDALRLPIEEKRITIHRIASTITYPCNIMLVASLNPCPSGYYRK